MCLPVDSFILRILYSVELSREYSPELEKILTLILEFVNIKVITRSNPTDFSRIITKPLFLQKDSRFENLNQSVTVSKFIKRPEFAQIKDSIVCLAQNQSLYSYSEIEFDE